jgi:predicted Fe-Mo cluster-binding NifX family protein
MKKKHRRHRRPSSQNVISSDSYRKTKAASAFRDIVEEAEAEELAVERDGADGAIVLNAAGFGLVDLDEGDTVDLLEVGGAELADLLAPGAGVIDE